LDGKVPPGIIGQLALPFGLWLMKRTMLGNPSSSLGSTSPPWREGFLMEEFVFGSWYVCWGTKTAPAQTGAGPTGKLLAAE
jgi:hypothetical protein